MAPFPQLLIASTIYFSCEWAPNIEIRLVKHREKGHSYTDRVLTISSYIPLVEKVEKVEQQQTLNREENAQRKQTKNMHLKLKTV